MDLNQPGTSNWNELVFWQNVKQKMIIPTHSESYHTHKKYFSFIYNIVNLPNVLSCKCKMTIRFSHKPSKIWLQLPNECLCFSSPCPCDQMGREEDGVREDPVSEPHHAHHPVGPAHQVRRAPQNAFGQPRPRQAWEGAGGGLYPISTQTITLREASFWWFKHNKQQEMEVQFKLLHFPLSPSFSEKKGMSTLGWFVTDNTTITVSK